MADTLDVLTYEEANAAVSKSNARAGNDDTNRRLEMAVTAVSRLLDRKCGPIVIRTITDEIHYANGAGWVTPKYQPVVSVDTVTEYVSGTPTVLTAAALDTVGTYALEGGLIFRRSGWYAYTYLGSVKITYDAGRYETTETVDALFKEAASEILIGGWTKYGSAWSTGGDPLADPVFFDEVTQVVNRLLNFERAVPGMA